MSDKSNATITAKLAKLGELVAWFESDEFTIEQATDKFTEAETLATEIEQDLSQFKNETNVLKQKFDQ